MKDSSQIKTIKTKQHYEILDGLRGTAAILVVIGHIIQMRFTNGGHLNNPIIHSYLAVDFFFCLSGFVIAYAYDARWDKFTVFEFLKQRIIRLHPMVVLGVIIGLLCYIFDPFLANSRKGASGFSDIVISFIAAMFLMPSETLNGRANLTHSLNSPHWTLLQEYIANFFYAVILRRLNNAMLLFLVVISGLALLQAGHWYNTLNTGYSFKTLWVAPIRLSFSFLMGLLLFRIKDYVKLPKLGFITLSFLLLLSFAAPRFTRFEKIGMNGLYDAAIIIILFPLMILCGAHFKNGIFRNFANTIGKLSYPLYAIHFPIMGIYASYVLYTKPHGLPATLVAVVITPIIIYLGWIAYKYWDEPVRAWLRKKFI